MLQSLPTVRITVASVTSRTRPDDTGRSTGGFRTSTDLDALPQRQFAELGVVTDEDMQSAPHVQPCFDRRAQYRSPRTPAAVHLTDAMPISRMFGRSGNPAATDATTGIAPPNPSTSCTVRPACHGIQHTCYLLRREADTTVGGLRAERTERAVSEDQIAWCDRHGWNIGTPSNGRASADRRHPLAARRERVGVLSCQRLTRDTTIVLLPSFGCDHATSAPFAESASAG